MKLYIVGNGFDAHHGLRTNYSDYSVFLKEKDEGLYHDFESFPGLRISNRGLWTDVEYALSLDYWEIMDELMKDYPNLSDDSDSRWHRMGISAELLKGIIFQITGPVFYEWLSSIDYSVLKPDLSISDDSVFITFNYTKVLELYYDIPSDRILHIHGMIDNCESIQFGSPDNVSRHCIEELEASFSDDDYYAVSIKDAVVEIGHTLDTVYKNQQSNYDLIIAFLDSKDIDEIIIMGHSFWGVDYPYYRDVIIPSYSDCNWTVYCHDDVDYDSAVEVLNESKIKKYRIIMW